MDGDVFFCGTDTEVNEERLAMCQKAMKPPNTSCEVCLGMGQRIRLQRYRILPKYTALKKEGRARIINVDQEPAAHCVVSELLPCQLRGCTLFSDKKKRSLLGKEHLSAALVGMYPELIGDIGVELPFFDHVPPPGVWGCGGERGRVIGTMRGQNPYVFIGKIGMVEIPMLLDCTIHLQTWSTIVKNMVKHHLQIWSKIVKQL
jgi:hypothetical protein